MALTLAQPDALDSTTCAALLSLVDAIELRDGEPPLSDQALTRLTSPSVRHFLVHDGADLVGYAQLDDASTEVAGDAATTSALLETIEASGGAGLVWSHGQRSPVREILERRGYQQVRVLHQLRRSLEGPLAVARLADGVRVRDFVPGRDEPAWLRVNAAAFASHPEQGRWTLADLLAREAESWFDPAGFLLAEREAHLIGFHWTKVHSDGAGEVYILGVDPAAQGLGLGRSLLELGLARLAGKGCPEVLLYVDDDNTSALHLYEARGFHRHDVDVQWHQPGQQRQKPQDTARDSA